MSVRDVLEAALYSTLKGGTALISELGGTAIYNLQPPDNTPLPYIVYGHVAGGPDNITPSDSWSQLYLVRAFAATQVKVRAIDSKFDALLHRQALTVTGYTNYWTVRENDVSSTVESLPNGEKAYSSGGYYRIKLDA